MQDYELSILEQYPISVKCTRKTRGAFFCDTDQGLFLLREAGMSKRHVLVMRELCLHLYKEGHMQTDLPVANCEGEYISTSLDGRQYILKQWFKGRECDIRKSRELLEGTSNLAHLHRFMERVPDCGQTKEEGEAQSGQKEKPYADVPEQWRLQKEYSSHNKELKKIRKFIRSQSPKGEFELEFLRYFDSMFAWAEQAEAELHKTSCQKLWEKSTEQGTMIHGDYNYHNVLVTAEGMATTNFDKCRIDVQMEDLYYYLRKAMEKHGWNIQWGDHMLDAYSAIRPLSPEDLEYLKIRLVYPEKFWKLAASYYRSNKAWIPVKNVEKLKTAVRQNEEKSRFLSCLFAFRL